jgi:hypothetical protein
MTQRAMIAKSKHGSFFRLSLRQTMAENLIPTSNHQVTI